MNIPVETITLKDGSRIDVIRDVEAVRKVVVKLEAAHKAIRALLHCNHGEHEIPYADAKALRALV